MKTVSDLDILSSVDLNRRTGRSSHSSDRLDPRPDVKNRRSRKTFDRDL